MLNKIQMLLLSIIMPCLAAAESKLPFKNSDFESSNLSNWTAKGTAFGNKPFARDAAANDQRLHGTMQGEYCANSRTHGHFRSDSLTSTPFTLDQDYLTFLIAGGMNQGTASKCSLKVSQ